MTQKIYTDLHAQLARHKQLNRDLSECYPKTSESSNGNNWHMNVPAQVAQAQYVSVIISTYIVKRVQL